MSAVLLAPAISDAFTIRAVQKISQTSGGFGGIMEDGDQFGGAVAPTGDLDGDGILDVIVGAPKDNDGSSDKGASWVLFLNDDGTVRTQQKISSGNGNFVGGAGATEFGAAIAPLGDLDGDGIGDVAIGAEQDNDGGTDRGAVWILRLNANGAVKSSVKISSISGNLTGPLENDDKFGASVAALGDIDGDGVVDIAVGAPKDDDLGGNHGAVWILFLNANGTVKAERKITTLAVTGGGAAGGDELGSGVAALGDLDGDGTPDLAVGAPLHKPGSAEFGAAWVLFLNPDGSVKSGRKITSATAGFTGALDDKDLFGDGLAGLGSVEDDGTITEADLDDDGTVELAVGAPGDDDGGDGRGAVWILHLQPDGTVASHDKIAIGSSGLVIPLDKDDLFGSSVAAVGDLDGDGVSEIAVGAPGDDDGGGERGATWILFPETCGNGIVSSGEQCDDGNRIDGDCCSADCQFEANGGACSDGNGCTDDQCNATGTCVSTANIAPCEDGLFCNGTDTCGAGACSVHNGDPCLGPDGDGDCSESCDETLDNCSAPDPDTTACDDGLFCNGIDTCSDGLCGEHSGNPCPGVDGDGDCAESCDEAGDDCNDPDLDGSTCDDGVFCNGTDTCQTGACMEHSGDPCVGADGDFDCAESCNEAGSNCFAADLDGSSCNDGLFCNGADSCAGGNCASHLGDPCTGGAVCNDSCNEGTDDCLVADGVSCDDGQFCTATDTCGGGTCSGSTNPCGEGTPSCTDTCNESEGICKICGEPASGTYCLPNAVITLRAAIGLTTCDVCLCDVDGNGSVLVTDSLRLLRVCVEIDPPPAACPATFETGSTTTSTMAAATTTSLAPTAR